MIILNTPKLFLKVLQLPEHNQNTLFVTFQTMPTENEKVKQNDLVVRPIILVNEINLPCNVDLIDMQTKHDGEYYFIPKISNIII